MNLEIPKPELMRRLSAQIKAARFNDAEEVLERALDALDEKKPLRLAVKAARRFCRYCKTRLIPRLISLRRESVSPCKFAMLCLNGVACRYEHSFYARQPRPNPRIANFFHTHRNSELYVGIVTFAEIRFGIELLDDRDPRMVLSDWLMLKLRPMFDRRVLPVTEDILVKWRFLMEQGRKTGRTFSQIDLIIAATTLHYGLTVVTRDRTDFEKANVPVFNPWD